MIVIFFIVMIFVTISFKSQAVIVVVKPVVGLLVVLAAVADYFVDFVALVQEVVELEQIQN